MPRTRLSTVAIFIVGVITGIIFAYLTRGTGHQVRTFATLATVQGAFIGIVFSIFVLASQVSASEFSPLTLEQLSRSREFAALILFYVGAILINIYFVQVNPASLSLPYIPRTWNIPVGIGTGVTTISLLSLLIARQLLVSLTSPEHLLARTATSIDRERLTMNATGDYDSPPPKPERTTLLTMERILVAADERDDEYTLQQATYHMYTAIFRLLSPPNGRLRGHFAPTRQKYVADLDLDTVFNRWGTCIAYGTEGPIDRRMLTIQSHRQLLVALLNANCNDIVEAQLDGLTELCAANFAEGQFDPTLLNEYDAIMTVAVKNDAKAVRRAVGRQLSTLSSQLLSSYDGTDDPLPDGNHDMIAEIMCARFRHISDTIGSGGDTGPNREFAGHTLDDIDETLDRTFDALDDHALGRKQNLLTSIHDAAMPVPSAIIEKDNLLAHRMVIVVAELSVALDRDAAPVAERMCKAADDQAALHAQVDTLLAKFGSGAFDSRELTAIDCSNTTLKTFIERLAAAISKQTSSTEKTTAQ